MNKKLLALAIGATVAMPVVALAEGPTLYGQLDVSLTNTDTGAATGDVWSIESNASRVGIKGSADTSVDGLKGIYLAEFAVYADDGLSAAAGSTPLTQRNIYAGLQGNFGTVLMGNVDTPVKTVQGNVDQFNDTAADIAAYTAGEFRAPNILAYVSPKLADSVTATVALWQGETAPAAAGVGDATSLSVVYQQEAIYAGLGMDLEVPSTGGIALTAGSLRDITRLVFGYAADAVEVGFMYQMAEEDVSAAEDTTMVLSGSFKSGDLKVKAQYGQTEGDTGAATNTATMLALGADYMVGKATTVYGLFATSEDDVALDTQVLSFGIKQKF